MAESNQQRPFWPRGRDAVMLAVMLAITLGSVFGGEWLRDNGWSLWARCALLSAVGGVVAFTATRLVRRDR